MAADSDGSLTAVVICEGNLHDPEFPRKFRHLVTKLKHILQQPKKSKKLKVNKVIRISTFVLKNGIFFSTIYAIY